MILYKSNLFIIIIIKIIIIYFIVEKVNSLVYLFFYLFNFSILGKHFSYMFMQLWAC